MAKKLAIPEDRREWPDWEYRPFPKWLGRDEVGADLIANSEAEVEELMRQVVYPIDLGHNAKGALIQAMHPDELQMKKNQVTRPLAVEKAEAETATVDLSDTKPVKKNKAA